MGGGACHGALRAVLTVMRQIPLAIVPQPVQGFDRVVAGRNGAVLAHLQQVVAGLPCAGLTPPLPTYLWSGGGGGKTRWLQATAEAAEQRGQPVAWYDPARPLPWRLETGASLLVLDACERFDDARQHAAFTLFIESQALAVPVLAAGRVPPTDLPLRDDLRTRLGWGHVFALHTLDECEVRAALRGEAERRGIALGDEVLDYLLTRFSRDFAHLLGLLDKLDEFALSRQRAITVPLLRRLFEEEGHSL